MSKLCEEYEEQLDELWSEAMREESYHSGYKHALQEPIYRLFEKEKDKFELMNRLIEEQHIWEARAEYADNSENSRFADGSAQACKDTIEMLKTTR